MSTTRVTVQDVLANVHSAFPFEWAEPWDAVGLLAGDPEAVVESVLVTLDVTREVVARARETGSNVIVTHHPAFLDPPSRLTPGIAGPAFDAVAAGIALIAAHTNLDRSPQGAQALPALLGLQSGQPLEESRLPLSSVVVYVPAEHLSAVEQAMVMAGAGRVGRYDGCSFALEGTGSFTPREDASPFEGTPGIQARVQETRLESVCPSARVGAVVSAIRSAHPYEEPLIVVAEVGIARGSARMGRVCELAEDVSLAAFAHHLGERIGIVPRVRGDKASTIARVAVATGSASSLVGVAIAAGVDALVAGEVRYHDAVSAVEAGLAIVELGHDVSEWPLVPVLADAVRTTPGLPAESVYVDRPHAGYWTP